MRVTNTYIVKVSHKKIVDNYHLPDTSPMTVKKEYFTELYLTFKEEYYLNVRHENRLVKIDEKKAKELLKNK